MRGRTKVKRISINLDSLISDIAIKSGRSFPSASEEVARLAKARLDRQRKIRRIEF